MTSTSEAAPSVVCSYVISAEPDLETCNEPAVDKIGGQCLCRKHAAPPPGHIIVDYGGSRHFGTIIPFETAPHSEEDWISYGLGDGRVLRVRHIVKRVVRIVGLVGADGLEVYTFTSEVVSDVVPTPTTLKELQETTSNPDRTVA